MEAMAVPRVESAILQLRAGPHFSPPAPLAVAAPFCQLVPISPAYFDASPFEYFEFSIEAETSPFPQPVADARAVQAVPEAAVSLRHVPDASG